MGIWTAARVPLSISITTMVVETRSMRKRRLKKGIVLDVDKYWTTILSKYVDERRLRGNAGHKLQKTSKLIKNVIQDRLDVSEDQLDEVSMLSMAKNGLRKSEEEEYIDATPDLFPRNEKGELVYPFQSS